ncbi:MAG: metal-dependent hydrolase [Humidesulfovibrio sp.]|uniref:metal-dependent hydrolase n=1 Tax=Humidesulfovibrio sp. TaxID=2910988 RepID=UPI002736634F|nr:metal-dependent hydrolase [Humidesulfovibrio sp.]MDP2848915.1 metal-dependent hydrolase [Humidesulfovibrio sp.]
MEPVTHLAAGLLTAQALRPALLPGKAAARGFTLLCCVAATIPDVDSLSGLLGPESYLLHHRGLTHSIFFLPFFALLLAWAARRLGADAPLRHGFMAAALALMTHLFLDVATTFGTQLFTPFSNTRISFEGVFIVDPIFTLALLSFALAARLSPRQSQTLALCGLGLLLGYPMLGNALRLDMQARYEALLTARGTSVERVSITPDAFSPYYWKVVLEDGQEVRVTTATIFDLAAPHPVLRFLRLERSELLRLSQQASFFGTYAWFAIHPAEWPAQADGSAPPHARRFLDAAYVNASPVMAALFRQKTGFAECAAYFDDTGRLVAWSDWSGRTHPVPEAGAGPASAKASSGTATATDVRNSNMRP